MARKQIYAPPLVFGPWEVVGSHIGEVNYSITVEPIGDTLITGEVKYFKRDGGAQVTEAFSKQTSVSTSNSVANVEVRLKGTPTGSSCWVDTVP